MNCFNPYEQSETLNQIKKDPNFIEIKPEKHYNYGEILKNAFLKLPEAYELKKQHKYYKKIFPCCYYIKHKAFLNDPIFQESNVVIISGIKRGDGLNRFRFLIQLKKGNTHICGSKYIANELGSTFFYKHRKGQLYAYPFRDYTKRELPKICIKKLKRKYPSIEHSNCSICPVVVLFELKHSKNYQKSIEYASKLNVLSYKPITKFM